MSEISELRDAIKNLHGGMQKATGAIVAAIPLATITAGLSGTTQGLQLDWEFKKLATEITDALLPAIKSFTAGIHVVNAGLHRMNAAPGQFWNRGPLGAGLESAVKMSPLGLTAGAITSFSAGGFGGVKEWMKDLFNPTKPQRTTEAPREHLTPIWQTSFGSVEDLWKNMQAMATENPAEDFEQKSLDVFGQILLAIINLGLIMQGLPAMSEQEALKGNA